MKQYTPIAELKPLKKYVEKSEFRGWDPYDALNSPLLKAVSSKSKLLRIAFTQFMRRSPINLRPVLNIPKSYNPKGLGLFMSAYARLYFIEKKPSDLQRIQQLKIY